MKERALTLKIPGVPVGWNGLAYLELTKPRITFLILLTTATGFYMGSWGNPAIDLLLHTLLGTTFLASGASALNNLLDRDIDCLMKRTADRALPSGRLSPLSALRFGILFSCLGIIYLTTFTSLIVGLLGVFTLIGYIGIYTPLKRKTSVCTLIGAIPGAMPPLIGWVAARGSIELAAWVLFSILFLWQLPHFLAIAWLYRDDYLCAGLPMFTVLDPEGRASGRQMVLYTMALLPVSLIPTLIGLTGMFYFYCALILGITYVAFSIQSALFPSGKNARRLFIVSIAYLPILLAIMAIDKH